MSLFEHFWSTTLSDNGGRICCCICGFVNEFKELTLPGPGTDVPVHIAGVHFPSGHLNFGF